LLERNYDYRLTLAEVRQKGLDAERKRSGNAFDITPAQFCALIRVGVQSQSPVRMLLFPQISEASRGIQLRKLSPSDAATRLRASFFGSSAPGSTSEVFALSSADRCTDHADSDGLCAALAMQVQSFDCRLGPDAYHHSFKAGFLNAGGLASGL